MCRVDHDYSTIFYFDTYLREIIDMCPDLTKLFTLAFSWSCLKLYVNVTLVGVYYFIICLVFSLIQVVIGFSDSFLSVNAKKMSDLLEVYLQFIHMLNLLCSSNTNTKCDHWPTKCNHRPTKSYHRPNKFNHRYLLCI